MSDHDDDTSEEPAQLECEMIDAANMLVAEYGYTREDILGILTGTVFGH